MDRLVLVIGPPASGKTTLAHALAPRLGLPILSKDRFKEELFAESSPPETGRRAWSRRLSDVAWDRLFREAARLDEVLIEGNLPGDRIDDVRALHPHPVQIFCTAAPRVLVERVSSRLGRHPGHDDPDLMDEIAAGTVRGSEPLQAGSLIEVRTDGEIDLEALVQRIRGHAPSVQGRD